MDTVRRISRHMRRAILELDTALGTRGCGIIVSGVRPLEHRDIRTHESPIHLTSRVLIYPVMEAVGYERIPVDEFGEAVSECGLVLVFSSMNTPQRQPVSRMLSAMRRESLRIGLSTDGFMWFLAVDGRVIDMVDLRPYYVEFLELSRFRGSVQRDRSDLESFARRFSNCKKP